MRKQQGFGAVEALLILVIVGTLVGITAFMLHGKAQIDARANQTKAIAAATLTPSKVSTFAECVKAPKSRLLESYPETCVTSTGKKFTNPDQNVSTPAPTYLVIKEWGMKVKLSAPGAYYKVSFPPDTKDLTVYSTNVDALTGPNGVSCKGEFIVYLKRLPANDPTWDQGDNNLFGNRKTIGTYTYALATKKEYGPECFDTGTSSDYTVDPGTSTEFANIVNKFKSDFATLEAN